MKKTTITLLALAGVMAFSAGNAAAYTTSFYAKQSLLATDNIVKVAIDTTGVYQFTYAQLQEMGFSDPSKVNVYGYGGVVATDNSFDNNYPDDVPQTAAIHTSDGRLIFYGEGTYRATYSDINSIVSTRNVYSDKAYYFLSDREGAEVITTHDIADTSGSELETLDWGYTIDVHERDVQNPGKGSIYFHDKPLTTGEKQDFTFRIRNYDKRRNSKLYFKFEAAVISPSNLSMALSVSDNVSVTTSSISRFINAVKSTLIFRTNSGYLAFAPAVSGGLQDEDVTFGVQVPTNFTGTYAAMDRAYVIYPAMNILGDRDFVTININNGHKNQQFSVAQATPTTEVWDVTDPVNVYRYQLDYEDGVVKGTLSNAKSRIIAFDKATTHPTPSVVGKLANQNLHGTSIPDMLIVCAKSWREGAEELAEIHRQYQGLDVAVCTQEEVFNEFSSGVPHANAIRRLVKMYYDRDTNHDKMRYLLLYGSANFDMRGLQSVKDTDPMVTHLCENIAQAIEHTTNYSSDMYFGMMLDNFDMSNIYCTKTQISVGRIPISNPGQISAINNKIKNYFENPPTIHDHMRTLHISCLGDNESHLMQSTEVADIMRNTSPAYTAIHADKKLYPEVNNRFPEMERVEEQALNAGIGYFCYCGHGNRVALDGGHSWEFYHINKYKYRAQPFAMLATCNSWGYDQQNHCVAEKMLFQPDGGMIALMASCRYVYLEQNRTFNNAMASAYANAPDGMFMGDLPRLARNELIDNGLMTSTLGYNTLCYNYCGDPAIPIVAPTHSIVIDKINDVDLTAEDASVNVNALDYFTLNARVVDRNGNTVTRFNGSAVITVFESPQTWHFSSTTGTPKVEFDLTKDHETISEVVALVKNGVINHKVFVNNPERDIDYNRLSIVAQASNGATAAGGTRAMAVSYASAAPVDIDVKAPVIEEAYLNTQDFVNGGRTGMAPTFYAVIDPSEFGLEMRQTGIHNATSLILDDKVRLTNAVKAVTVDEDGKIRMAARITDLKEGRHSLTLKAVNYMGASDQVTLDFDVVINNSPAQLIMQDDDKPVRTQAEFDLITNETDLTVNRLVIVDDKGKTVFSQPVTMPFSWNLTDNAGKPVADGLYKANALYSTDIEKSHTQPIELIVLRR